MYTSSEGETINFNYVMENQKMWWYEGEFECVVKQIESKKRFL